MGNTCLIDCISSAPEFFQKTILEIIRGCDGVIGLIDDILVNGKTDEEHHEHLTRVLVRLRKEGVTLNVDKCVFYSNVIHFLGEKATDEEKIKAIFNIQKPTNVTEIRRFLGMINQLSKFSPYLAEKTKPLCELISKKTQWYWGPEQDRAFSDLKSDLKST